MDRRAAFLAVLLALGLALALPVCKSGPPPADRDEAAALERKAAHIERLLARRSSVGSAFEALVVNLPDRVWLTEAVYDAGKLRTKGIAPSNTILADYISLLGQSPALANVALAGSVLKTVQGYQWVEFSVLASVRHLPPGAAPVRASAAPTAARLAELEASLPPRPPSSGMLRDFQRLGFGAGLQMTKYEPGADLAGEFTAALPLAIEVSGSWDGLVEYLRGLGALPTLWIVEKLSARAATPDDPRSPMRASLAAKAHFPL
jgi:Fimbrial assembly protein (PilN)/Pilus assembly protein, PilO